MKQYPQQAPGTTAQTLWNEWYGQKRFHQEPLYPYLVAATYRLTGDDVRHVFSWQMVLGCATNLLIYLLARELMGEVAAVVVGVLALGYGPFLYYEMLLLREAALIFATVALMYLTVIADRRNSWQWWLGAGAAIGVGLLLKTTLSLFFACAVLAIVVRNWPNWRRTAFCAAATLAGVVIALSPAIVRNLRVGVGATELSSVGTITFINSNAFDDSNNQFGFTFWSAQHTPDILGKSNGRFLPALVDDRQDASRLYFIHPADEQKGSMALQLVRESRQREFLFLSRDDAGAALAADQLLAGWATQQWLVSSLGSGTCVAGGLSMR